MWFRTELCAANETAKWLTSLAYLRSSRRITRQHNISAASRPIFKDAGFYPDHHRDRFGVEALKGITGEDASWPQNVENVPRFPLAGFPQLFSSHIYATEILSDFKFGSLFIHQERKRGWLTVQCTPGHARQRPPHDATDWIKMARTMAVSFHDFQTFFFLETGPRTN